jgi:hypothetical protein
MKDIGQASSLEPPERRPPQRGAPDPDNKKISTIKGGRSRAQLLGLAYFCC